MQANDQPRTISMSHPVLVPVDFSDCARAALIYAARMISPDTRARLLVLHVIHDSGDAPGSYCRHGDNPLRPIADVAGAMLEDWLNRVRRETPELGQTLARARRRLVGGLPGSRIVEVAATEQAAMIVMGTRGRHGLAQLLRGSVTDYVLAHASVPVTTLREGRDGDAGRFGRTAPLGGAVPGDP